MTRDRAEWIWNNQDKFLCQLPISYEEHEFFWTNGRRNERKVHPQGITREEDAFIRMVWKMMGGNKSYYDALASIAGVELE